MLHSERLRYRSLHVLMTLHIQTSGIRVLSTTKLQNKCILLVLSALQISWYIYRYKIAKKSTIGLV